MDGTYQVQMGDCGRIVVPAAVRESGGLSKGTPLIMVDTGEGLLLLTRDQLRGVVRSDLDGADLVSALLADRRSGDMLGA